MDFPVVFVSPLWVEACLSEKKRVLVRQPWPPQSQTGYCLIAQFCGIQQLHASNSGTCIGSGCGLKPSVEGQQTEMGWCSPLQERRYTVQAPAANLFTYTRAGTPGSGPGGEPPSNSPSIVNACSMLTSLAVVQAQGMGTLSAQSNQMTTMP